MQRAFTQKKATEYGVTGWVQNSPDGRVRVHALSTRQSFLVLHRSNCCTYFVAIQVEGEIQGEDGLVQKLLQDVNKGPRHAHVVKLEKSDIETAEGESAFTIRK